MARRWQPKHKCHCTICGWTGKRTAITLSYPCPKCYPGRKMTKRLGYIRTVKWTIAGEVK